jgi:raffinose/stachyose/melibiose transport system permease protein
VNNRKGSLAFAIAFLAPCFVLYVVFVLFAISVSLGLTVSKWSGIGAVQFNGLRNYVELVQDAEYWGVARNSMTLVMLAVLIQNPLGLLLAYMVSRVGRGYRIFRSTIFLPVVIPAASTALMFSLLFNNDLGFVNNLLKSVGLGFLQQNWLTDPKIVIYTVALPQVWQYLGIVFIIYLAAIQAIPEEIIESARIDGASAFQTMMRIIVPLLWQVIQICIILNVSGSLKAFDMPWVMTWGGPGTASSYISVLMFRYAIKGFNFSYGTTIGMTILLYSLAFTIVFKKLVGKDPTEGR